MTQEVPELPLPSPLKYALRIYNRLALRHHQDVRLDCADIAREADEEIAALRAAITQAVADAQRLRGELGVLVEVLRECHYVIETLEPESTDEDIQLNRLLESIKRIMLLRADDERALANTHAAEEQP
jgi:hypothetical protein